MTLAATLCALLLLTTSALTLGRTTLQALPLAGIHPWERLSLQLTAGLGLCALLLSLLALCGLFAQAPWVLAALGTAGGIQLWRNPATARTEKVSMPVWSRVLGLTVAATVVLACAGAVAPVTDDDALAYVIPIAQHIADTGELRVWSDQARSMWPQSQPMLLAFMLHLGSGHLGMLTALQMLLAFGAVSALARRVCERSENALVAVVIALGAPTVAFLASSAKEDLWLVAASATAAFCLAGNNTRAEIAAAGLFAGIAAAAKYPGAGVLLAVVLWVVSSVRERRLTNAAVVVLAATASGGLWYALNLWRYGNPVAPFIAGASGTPLSAAVMHDFTDGFGLPRTLLNFILVPLRMFIDSAPFTGRSGWFNPLAWAGFAALVIPHLRRRHAPLLFMAAVLYTFWFFTMQNSRLLLPAMALLAPAAADLLVPLCLRWYALRVPAVAVLTLSLGIVGVVGTLRFGRYLADPASFLLQQTQNYEDIEWMNEHLDPSSHRVASDHKALGYLHVPWINLDPTYTLEFTVDEYGDQQRLLNALRRQHVTHLFTSADTFAGGSPQLRVLYRNPSSHLGGTRFFREPDVEATVLYELLPVTTP